MNVLNECLLDVGIYGVKCLGLCLNHVILVTEGPFAYFYWSWLVSIRLVLGLWVHCFRVNDALSWLKWYLSLCQSRDLESIR